MPKTTAKSRGRSALLQARAKTSGDGQPAAKGPLSPELLGKMDAYWRASNYLSVGQIYLLANPLLGTALKREHIKPRLLGHWGTTRPELHLCPS
jgi:xylulose-5-phosphate/fructose-6-phosphate phosphoketolase